MNPKTKILLGLISAAILLTAIIGVAYAANPAARAAVDKAWGVCVGACGGEQYPGGIQNAGSRTTSPDPDELISQLVQAKKEALENSVKKGAITEEQSGLILEQYTERVTARINGTAGSGYGNCGEGGPGAGNCGSCGD